MTYEETLEFLYSQLPQYQKIGGKAYKANLDNITFLCNLLGNPQNQLKAIHVAGTNGKGSTCNILSSIFQESGYKTGLFSSPHIIDFRERIRINGEMIPKEEVIDFVRNYQQEFLNIKPSFFEWSTALAFYYFAKEKVDIAIIETGLGGRLDSTNILSPILSVITSIGIDHTSFLGDTLEEIAFEKGGIIKPNTPVVLGEQILPTISTFKKIAQKNNAPVYIANIQEDQPSSSLLGGFQQYNVATSLKCIEVLKGDFPNISTSTVTSGLSTVQKNTGIRGRWEVLQEQPKVIADIGHNAHAIKETVKQLSKEEYKKLHVVWGMVEDKDIAEVVSLLPENAHYHLCSPNIKRSLSTKDLSVHFTSLNSTQYSTCNEAYTSALSMANKDDLILIGGSTFVVTEIICDFFQ